MVLEQTWDGKGPEFTLRWGGRPWMLKVDEASPGLRLSQEQSCAKLLFLDSLAAVGRIESGPFSPEALVGFEALRNRVQVTYAPPGWGGLRVRAAWSTLAARDAVNLEIEVAARSVGELQRLEVRVRSVWLAGGAALPADLAERKKPAIAGERAADKPVRELSGSLRMCEGYTAAGGSSSPAPPHAIAVPGWEPDVYYVEMVHPNDVARRIMDEGGEHAAAQRLVLSTRYCLFGHDLEKGVVLRGRLRGLFIRSRTPEDDARASWREFQTEPLPLGP